LISGVPVDRMTNYSNRFVRVCIIDGNRRAVSNAHMVSESLL